MKGIDQLLTAAHVWHGCPDDTPQASLERACLGWLTDAERWHRDRLRTDALRHDYLATRALCRATLSRYTGIDPADWRFTAGARGKPRIDRPAGFSRLRFNLTHTAGLVACIVTRAGDVGIDAEETSRIVDVEQVARHFFTAAEQSRLQTLSPKRRPKWFYEQWVVKEALLKGRGTGLSESLRRLTIEWNGRGKPQAIGNWQLALHRPTRRHVAATAVRPWRGGERVAIDWFAVTNYSNVASPS